MTLRRQGHAFVPRPADEAVSKLVSVLLAIRLFSKCALGGYMKEAAKNSRLVGALDHLTHTLWGWLINHSLAKEEVGKALTRAEAEAMASGPIAATICDALFALGFESDTLWHHYERTLEEGHFEIAQWIAAIFELIAPDEGSIERARLRVSNESGSPDPAVEWLERAALDPGRDPWCRGSALTYLADLAPPSFARAAPEALRIALASNNRKEAYEVAETLVNVLFDPPQPKEEEWAPTVIPLADRYVLPRRPN